jgi:hypothetical protein
MLDSMRFRVIERHRLHGSGIGYIDVHRLASVALTSGARLRTRERRLRSVAEGLGLAVGDSPTH